VIVDIGSSINTILSKVTERLGLKAVPHPYLYKVSWINFTILEVKQRCLVPVDFNMYKDKI